MSEIIIPGIVANIDGHEQQMNLVSYDLLANRIIYLYDAVTDMTALNVTTQMRYLESRSEDPITLVINSPGGSVSAGMVIYDCMKSLRCPVNTVATGMAASMGAFLLAAGTKGRRYATPSAEIMIHQPLGGAQGQATDIQIVAENIIRIKRKLAAILAEACGKPLKTVIRDTERDNWMTADEALKYGLIDSIGYPE